MEVVVTYNCVSNLCIERNNDGWFGAEFA